MLASKTEATVAKITLDIADPVHQWLNAEAGNRGLSLEQFIAGCLQEQRSRLMLSADEVHVLGILQNVSVKRGWTVPARSLRTIWGIRGSAAELETALRGLTARGFVEAVQNGDGFKLTEFGFSYQAR